MVSIPRGMVDRYAQVLDGKLDGKNKLYNMEIVIIWKVEKMDKQT